MPTNHRSRPLAGPSPSPSSPPTKKRRRVLQACLQCRARKEKCNGAHPTCSSCLSSSQSCTYASASKRRGLAPGYVRLLETVLGMIIKEVVGGEATVRGLLERCVKGMGKEERGERLRWWKEWEGWGWVEEVAPGVEFLDERELERRKSAKVEVGGGVESVGQGRGSGGQDDVLPTYVWEEPGAGFAGGSSNTDSQQLTMEDVSFQPQGEVGDDGALEAQPMEVEIVVAPSISVVPHPAQPQTDALDPSREHDPPLIISQRKVHADDPDNLQLPENAWQLLDIYFTYTHSWFPILDRAATMQSFSSYSTSETSSGSEHLKGASVLWAILAHSAHQNGKEQPNGSHTSTFECARAYDISRKMTHAKAPKYDLSSAQSLLLLSLIDIGASRAGSAWIMVGQAARIALDMASQTDPADRGNQMAQKQTLLGCFVLDTLLSALLQRSPQLHTQDFKAIGNLDETGLEEWDFWRPMAGFAPHGEQRMGTQTTLSSQPARTRSVFGQLCCLMSILNDGTTAHDAGLPASVHSNTAGQLQKWVDMLPLLYNFGQHLRRETISSLPHITHLHMIYCSTLLMLDTNQGGINYSISSTLPTMDAVARCSIWLLDAYAKSFSSGSAPATFSIFTSILDTYIKRSSTINFSISERFTFDRISSAVAEVWATPPKPADIVPTNQSTDTPAILRTENNDSLSNTLLAEDPSQRQPRFLRQFMDLADLDTNNATSANASTAFPTADAHRTAMSNSIANTDTLAGETWPELFNFEPMLDTATFQNMLQEYGTQRNEEQSQADFWRNLGFFD